MRYIKLKEVDKKKELYIGTILRKYNVGMNPDVVSKENDFYDYIFTCMPWDRDWMILVNITKNNIKAGSVYLGSIKINFQDKSCVLPDEVIEVLDGDIDDWYLKMIG